MYKTITALILFTNIPWVDLMMLLVDILLYQLPLPRLQIHFELNLIIKNRLSAFISSFECNPLSFFENICASDSENVKF